MPQITGKVLEGTCSASVTLEAYVMNNGNALPDAATATFYADTSLTDVIRTVAADPPRGCAREAKLVTVTWEGLCAGTHEFGVRVGSGESMSEASDNDNVATGVVVIEPVSAVYTYLPAILRWP